MIVQEYKRVPTRICWGLRGSCVRRRTRGEQKHLAALLAVELSILRGGVANLLSVEAALGHRNSALPFLGEGFRPPVDRHAVQALLEIKSRGLHEFRII